MKKVLLTLVVVLAGFASAQAQISEGAILLGASSNFGFTSTSSGGASSTVVNLHGKAGYFFKENLVGGARLDVTSGTGGRFGIGGFGRYYINGNIIVGGSLTVYNQDATPSNISYVGFGIEGGYAAFINDVVAVEPTLNIDIYGGDLDMTQIGINVGFAIYLNK